MALESIQMHLRFSLLDYLKWEDVDVHSIFYPDERTQNVETSYAL